MYLPAVDQPVFRQVTAPTAAQLQELVQQIAERIGKLLDKRGLVERDMESAWLTVDGPGGTLDDLISHSITYRIAVGPRAGQKLFTLQTLSASAMPEAEQHGDHRGAAQAGGFSLHAGIDMESGQRQKLERVCRYVSRPPVAVDRMTLTSSGQARYTLKTPYRDGTTHIVVEPPDLMARLVALVPPPRMHLTRYHGVFARHSKLRAAVTPAGRGRGNDGRQAASAGHVHLVEPGGQVQARHKAGSPKYTGLRSRFECPIRPRNDHRRHSRAVHRGVPFGRHPHRACFQRNLHHRGLVLLAMAAGVGDSLLARGAAIIRAVGRWSYEIYLSHMFVVYGFFLLFPRSLADRTPTQRSTRSATG